MAISINQITSGIALRFDGNIFWVIESQHIKPGKGSAFAKVRIKNVKTGQTLEKTLRESDRVDDVNLDERKLQLLYQAEREVHFMDHVSFEEVAVPRSVLGDAARFLQDGIEVIAVCHGDEVLQVKLPTFIVAQITHTEPGIKGDSSRAGNKPATIDTGATVLVPLFINPEDWIKIDTRTGQYVERVQK